MNDANPPSASHDRPDRRIPPPPAPRRPSVRAKHGGWPRSVTEMRSALDLVAEQSSVPYQRSRLFQAVDNVKAAHETERPNAIATLVYDALRAAVDVHVNMSGLKIAGKDQHQISVEYAHAELTSVVSSDDLEVYDELRLVRNRVVEYPPIGNFMPPTKDEAARYLSSADRFVAAIDMWWRSST